MQIDKQMIGDVLVVTLAGELDSRTAVQTQHELTELVPQAEKIVLNLAQTSYMSSAGLRVMLLVYRQARAAGIRLVLVGMPVEVHEVMSATGFLDFFTVSDTVPAGVEVLTR
ncbi:MAG: STAS domain-containing protein [Pseudonocardiaceae bacterium]